LLQFVAPQATFEDCFAKQYAIIHRLETNKLRNVAKLFAHLLSVDAISWGVLGCIRLTEDDTTSSSRIFIKYLFQVGFYQVLVLGTCFIRIVHVSPSICSVFFQAPVLYSFSVYDLLLFMIFFRL
jgi:hypothetical protein